MNIAFNEKEILAMEAFFRGNGKSGSALRVNFLQK